MSSGSKEADVPGQVSETVKTETEPSRPSLSPSFALIEQRDAHSLEDAIRALTRIIVTRVEKVERDQLTVMRDIAKHCGEIPALRRDLNELLDALVRRRANGALVDEEPSY